MKLELLQLEDRICPSAVTPVAYIVGVGTNAPDYIPMVQVMLGDNTNLLHQAGWNVGNGVIGNTINISSGSYTEQQLDQIIGQYISSGAISQGPNTMVLVFLDKPPINAPSNSAAYHDGFVYNGQEVITTWTWNQPWESIAAFHEYDEAVARMAGASFEICDAVNWQAEPLDGFNISNFVSPSGIPAFTPQKYIGSPWQITPVVQNNTPVKNNPSTPSLNDLFALGIEKIESDLFGLLARFNPAFNSQLNVVNQEIMNNPWNNTQTGQQIEHQADVIFINWLN